MRQRCESLGLAAQLLVWAHNLDEMSHPTITISYPIANRCWGPLMSPRVLEPSRAELEARRSRILARLSMTRNELESAADSGALTGEQYWLLEDIRSIEFLLGTDDDGR